MAKKIVEPEGPGMTDDFDKLGEIDVAFVIDTTSSMGPYIEEAKKHARALAEKVAAEGDLDIQYAVVEYRDHPPQDSTFASRSHGFGDAKHLEKTLASLSPFGGGDGPESVWDGVEEAGNLQWRPLADKRVFLIGDAPPHGYGYHADGFPEGCPCGLTAPGLAELYGHKGITLHAHSIAGDKATAKAFKEIAEATGGECTEVEHAAGSTVAYGDTLYAASASVDTSRKYMAMSASMPMAGDAEIAASMGVGLKEVEGTKAYLRKRGIKVDKGA